MTAKIDREPRKPIGIKQIDFGRNDGKLDSVERYFLDTGLIDRIKSRKAFFVLGRKGTGKTALAKHFIEISSGKWNEFATPLSLRNIPVRLLEAFEDKAQIQSGRFVLLWQFMLLVELAKQIIRDQTLDPDSKSKLEAIILASTPALSTSPDVYLKKTQESGYKLGLGTSALHEKNVSDGTSVDLMTYTHSLKQLVFEVAKRSNTYAVVIDELDDSYAESKDYFDLIIALFKAAMEINAKSSEERKRCMIVVALRDDIFDSIDYGDKNKWSDISIRINWHLKSGVSASQSDLFKMINLRIGASLVDHPKIDENYWDEVFVSTDILAKLKPFQFILSRTLYRPRDVIQFCKCIQDACPNGARRAEPANIKEAELAYSDWLLGEIVDEIHVKLPLIRQVFEAFRQLKQPTFRSQDIKTYLDRTDYKLGQNVYEVLSILYNFSVIGQFDDGDDRPIFRYRNPLRKFERGRNYSVHYGLRATLRLFGSVPKNHTGRR